MTDAIAEKSRASRSLPTARMRRYEVRAKDGFPDPRAEALKREAASIGVPCGEVRVSRIYLLHGPLDDAAAERVAFELLSNPVLEQVSEGASETPTGSRCLEVHPLPGVMDPPAQTVEMAVSELTGVSDVRASTGWRYDIAGVSQSQLELIANRLLANPVVQATFYEPYFPDDFPRGEAREFRLTHVPIRDLSDDELRKLSREGHLFLSLDEMRAIQAHYREAGREPTDIELETLAQTWSEHCVHKTLKSDVLYRGPKDDVIDWSNRPGVDVQPDGAVRINNLLKSTVAAATHELIAEGLDWTLSVFVDNAGIIKFDDANAVCVKVETHNHPSAIEPYGGAATGVGGCIRDIIGTGLAAKPIANTDVFCVAYPDGWIESQSNTPNSPSSTAFKKLPAGCLHPKRILQQVVAGVRDYGNRMGVPTVSGAVYFDDRYVGNPLVYCGCVGVMPIDKIEGHAHPGDVIVALGGRTGRDGIHGATFSSAELTDTHADEFSHAVQIGNAIEEKKVLDAILRARDAENGPLFHAITDCGAGGFSSAIGEMGEKLGAEVHLDRAPLKYDGLTYSEIWISEAQERMILAVPRANLTALQAICDEESVELAELGTFGTPDATLILKHHGHEVGRMSMEFLHEGLPKLRREASWTQSRSSERKRAVESAPIGAAASDGRSASTQETLLQLLAHPNIASKHWIVRQYDHEVQGGTVIKPLVGPAGDGPGDASVMQPVPGSAKGLAISQGLAVPEGDPEQGGDAYLMAIAGVDECVRNLVCVGADPSRIAILDNFCWPSCERPENLGSLVRASVGCYDAAKAYRTPFVSGKDSLNNQFTTEDGVTIEIPPTLLITGIGVVPDVMRCVTSDAKRAGSVIVLVGFEETQPSAAAQLRNGPRVAAAVAQLIQQGRVRSAHDVSEGGPLVALAEMLIGAADNGATIGCQVELDPEFAFAERPHSYVLEVAESELDAIKQSMGDLPFRRVGMLNDSAMLTGAGSGDLRVSVNDLGKAFRGTLDW